MTKSTSAAAAAAVSAAVTTAVLSYWYHHTVLRKLEADYSSKRQAERKGRIRAEVSLRTLQKQHKLGTPSSNNKNNNNEKDSHPMLLKCIGTVQSPYTKRMGTPRQGALVPSSRGCIQVHSHIPMETLSHLDEYSHAWILFGFHANTDLETSHKAKIKPPRGGGMKVGSLSTRSPHRPNPIGLSLVRVEKLEHKLRQLHIKGLDLVHGTPVYDIKPCVPWDIPGHYDKVPLRVPDWVGQEDQLSQVDFAERADQALARAVAEQQVAWPLYSRSNNGYTAAKETIQQVLAQDPRAFNKRGSATKSSENPYKIIFGSTQVEFVVTHSGSVLVVSVEPIEFPESAYVDGIPLASER